MPTKVHLPDGRIVNFPDGMAPAEIQAAMQRLSGPPQPAEAPAQAPPRRPVTLMGVSPPGGLRDMVDAGRGAVAGLTSTVFRGGDMLRRGWNAVAPDQFDVGRPIERPDVQAAMQPPQTTAGRVGFGAEQLGEFLYPVGRLSRAMQGASLPARIGAEGAAVGAVSAAQGGDPVSGAVTGAAGPIVGRAMQTPIVQRAAGAIRESAEQRIAQALGATKERFKAVAERLAPQMLDRGVPGRLGASRSGLLDQAKSQASAYGRAIDDALTNAADEPINTGLIVQALDDAKAAFQVPRRMTVQDAVQQGLTERARDVGNGMVEVSVVVDARPIQQLEQLQATLSQLGPQATVGQVVAIRRVWDDVVARAGGFAQRSNAGFGVPLAEQTEAWAKKEATTAIRRVLSEAQPDLAALNTEFAFWKNLQDVLTATHKRTQAQSGGLTRTILGGAGATAGAMTGDNTSDRMQNMVIGGLAGRQLMQVVQSPRWKFVSANVRNVLADALASGNANYVSAAIARATAAVNSGGGALRPVPAN